MNIVCIDAVQSQLTDKLDAKGMKVIIGHGKYKVQIGDAVIYSEAVAECEEVVTARKIMKEQKKAMVQGITQNNAQIAFEALMSNLRKAAKIKLGDSIDQQQ